MADERGEKPIIVLTREESDNAGLRALLDDGGAVVLDVPCISIDLTPPSEEELEGLPPLSEMNAAIFSSRNGVAGYFRWARSESGYLVKPDALLVGAVGPGTAEALRKNGWEADVIADPATGARLADLLLSKLGAASSILAVRGNTSRDAAIKKLGEAGHSIRTLTVYENGAPEIPKLGAYDIAVFASPLAAERFLEKNPPEDAVGFVAIGATTGRRLEEKGLRHVEAAATDDYSLASAVRELL